jgi:NAD-dependent SIR2 family protein deacetylase
MSETKNNDIFEDISFWLQLAMMDFTCGLDENHKTAILKTAIEKTKLIIIGAGSGLSSSAGMTYDEADIFNTLFLGHQHYDLHTINEASFYHFPSPEEYYVYWSRFISTERYKYLAGKLYLDLQCIIKDKNHFIPITNTDSQFRKAGSESKKICTHRGIILFPI